MQNYELIDTNTFSYAKRYQNLQTWRKYLRQTLDFT